MEWRNTALWDDQMLANGSKVTAYCNKREKFYWWVVFHQRREDGRMREVGANAGKTMEDCKAEVEKVVARLASLAEMEIKPKPKKVKE